MNQSAAVTAAAAEVLVEVGRQTEALRLYAKSQACGEGISRVLFA